MNKPPSVAIFVTLASVGLIQLQLMMFPHLVPSHSCLRAAPVDGLVVVVFIRRMRQPRIANADPASIRRCPNAQPGPLHHAGRTDVRR